MFRNRARRLDYKIMR
ncbi:hypothetical protein ACLB1E_23875 [Escherichia coli]